MNVKLFERRSRWERVADAVLPILEARSDKDRSPAAAAVRVVRDQASSSSGPRLAPSAGKAALAAAGGLAGLTAGSAAISARRRRGDSGTA